MESSEKNGFVLAALSLYVLVLVFAALDDLAGWYLLRPLLGN